MWSSLFFCRGITQLRSDIASSSRSFSTHAKCSTTHDPLRILFCGADDFSIYSLRALNDLKKRGTAVRSIDVVCKKDKRVGRGLKRIQEVPIKKVAGPDDLNLDIHQIDTFTGWAPPKPIDLIIAVSFGLLVPPRILNGAKYGGLNVHPSLLPDLRGPAPMHHTLLNRLTHTGVTLQTLHPARFDHGRIVAQTPYPGIAIPNLTSTTPASLVHLLGPLGADLLAHSILSGSYLLEADDNDGPMNSENLQSRHAPKITSQDRHIDWSGWSADEILLRDRVLGSLWDDTLYTLLFPLDRSSSESKDKDASISNARRLVSSGPPNGKRMTFHHWVDCTLEIVENVSVRETDTNAAWLSAGPLKLQLRQGTAKSMWQISLQTCDGRWVRPSEVTVEGKARTTVGQMLQNFRQQTSR